MASAINTSLQPFGCNRVDADLLFSMINIGIRRRDLGLILKALESTRTQHWSFQEERQLLMAAVACNIGTANPVLFERIATLALPSASTPPTLADILNWEATVAIWLHRNENFSLDVLYFHELASALLCYDREYMNLLCHRKELLSEWAGRLLSLAIQQPTREHIEECMLAFAYLMYLNPSLLVKTFAQAVQQHADVHGTDHWVTTMRAIAANLTDVAKCAPILYSFALLMLFCRNDLQIDSNGMITTLLNEQMADLTRATDVQKSTDGGFIVVPATIWDVTTRAGRAQGATESDYLNYSLRTACDVDKSADALAWLRDRYITRVCDHFQRQKQVVAALRATLEKKLKNKQLKLPKLSRAQRLVAEEHIAQLSKQLSDLNANAVKHFRPMYDAEQINATLVMLQNIDIAMRKPRVARSPPSAKQKTGKGKRQRDEPSEEEPAKKKTKKSKKRKSKSKSKKPFAKKRKTREITNSDADNDDGDDSSNIEVDISDAILNVLDVEETQ